MKLDIGKLEYRPTNTIDGFYERLVSLIPSLYEHRCSEGVKGGFFKRVKDGTWMGHVIEHIALEIQTLAGMYCPFGKTRSIGITGVYSVVFMYLEEEAGIYAGKKAIEIAEALIAGSDYDLQPDLKTLTRIKNYNSPGPTTQAIIREAQNRGIPRRRLDNDSLVLLGHGKHQQLISSSMTGRTSCIGVDIAGDKNRTKQLLRKINIPTPEGRVIRNEADLIGAARELTFPLVIKPLNGNHGRGVSINLTTPEELPEAFFKAKNISGDVLAERYITGSDFRILVINYSFTAASKRIPARVRGDGYSNILDLVQEANRNPDRGHAHDNNLTKIEIDDIALATIQKQGYTLRSVPEINETVYLKPTANLSSGGTGVDVTHTVHPQNSRMAERIARMIGLDICGIDIIAPDLSDPLPVNGGTVIEVNAEPGLRMHLSPSEGRARNVAKPIIDMLFPGQQSGRIPIAAVTGTNGKTTTARLLAHLAAEAGFSAGLTSSDGIYTSGSMIEEGDCTGPDSAENLLREPVDFAVLECARGGILRAGLGFSNCDVGIVTNISEDHLGVDDIHTLEQLTRLKGVVPNSVRTEGYAVLNADDDLVYSLREDLTCNMALFSLRHDHQRIQDHKTHGGPAIFLRDGQIIIHHDGHENIIPDVFSMPLTFGGSALFNIQNILAAVAAGYVRGFDISVLTKGLHSFIPTEVTLPGRMNLFHFPGYSLLIDYAHNPSAMKAVGSYIDSVDASIKTGIITAVGDRRDSDIIQLGAIAGSVFDEIIIKHDDDLRGRTHDEITMLLKRGIHQTDSDKACKVISSEIEAVQHAMRHARSGSFITALVADVPRVINLVTSMHEKSLKLKVES